MPKPSTARHIPKVEPKSKIDTKQKKEELQNPRKQKERKKLGDTYRHYSFYSREAIINTDIYGKGIRKLQSGASCRPAVGEP